jgi:hypothetical protein
MLSVSSDAAYPLSPPLSEGGTREGVLAIDVDIDEAATACGVGCTPSSEAVGTAFTLVVGSNATPTPGCEGRRPEVGRGVLESYAHSHSHSHPHSQ